MKLLRRHWFQIFVSGLILLILVERTLVATGDPNYVPSVILLGAFLVPVTFTAAYADWSEMASSADLGSARGVLETNLLGAWRVCQVFLPLIRRSGHGRIINVSSGASSHGDPQFGLTTNRGSAASYGISKAAINALTAKLAAELEGTGVLVNAVCPGLTASAPGRWSASRS